MRKHGRLCASLCPLPVAAEIQTVEDQGMADWLRARQAARGNELDGADGGTGKGP